MFKRMMTVFKNPTIGLDINDDAICMVSLRGRAGQVHLKYACQIALPAGAVVDGMVQQPEIVGAALKTLVKRHRLGRPKAVIAVAERHAQTHRLALDGVVLPLNPVALEQEVLAELDGHIDHAIEDFYIDFHPLLDGAVANQPLQVEVKCVPKAFYQNTLQALKVARVSPEIMDITPLALARNPWQEITVDMRSMVEGHESDYALSAALAMRGMHHGL